MNEEIVGGFTLETNSLAEEEQSSQSNVFGIDRGSSANRYSIRNEPEEVSYI